MSTNSAEADVLVVGAGPVGLYSVFALGQVGLRAIVIDARDEVGGQCAALYPEKPIYDIPSRPVVSGKTLIADLVKQARPYAPDFNLGRQVLSIERIGNAFEATLSDGARIGAGRRHRGRGRIARA